MPQPVAYSDGEEIKNKYNKFLNLRTDVLKALENARNNKVIGKSFNAKLTIKPTAETKELIESINVNLQRVFIVSQLEIVDNDINGEKFETGTILVEPAQGTVCSRCWQVVHEVNEDELCERCAAILK